MCRICWLHRFLKAGGQGDGSEDRWREVDDEAFRGQLLQEGHHLRDSLRLEAGWIVLTGGMTDAVFVEPGAKVAAHFTNLGSVTVSGG